MGHGEGQHCLVGEIQDAPRGLKLKLTLFAKPKSRVEDSVPGMHEIETVHGLGDTINTLGGLDLEMTPKALEAWFGQVPEGLAKRAEVQNARDRDCHAAW